MHVVSSKYIHISITLFFSFSIVLQQRFVRQGKAKVVG
jgi:hypothetical protein